MSIYIYKDCLKPRSEGKSSTLKPLHLHVVLPAALRTIVSHKLCGQKAPGGEKPRYGKSWFNTWWQQGTGSGGARDEQSQRCPQHKDMCAFLKQKSMLSNSLHKRSWSKDVLCRAVTPRNGIPAIPATPQHWGPAAAFPVYSPLVLGGRGCEVAGCSVFKTIRAVPALQDQLLDTLILSLCCVYMIKSLSYGRTELSNS